ncbi:cysteine desulfurase, partial [candidate division WWE3 bacterium CG_4_9_14_3_um_filter_41_6]
PRVIITTKIEHNSNLLPWQQLEDSGLFRLMYTPLKADLTVDIQGLTEITSKHPIAIVAISHVSNVTGTIQPIRTISETVKRLHPEAVIITDASQSIGHMSINVEQLRTDVLFFSGHKMYGPTGSGVIYVKETVLADLAPYHVGGGMAKTVTDHDYEPKRYPSRFEAGTPNIEGALGLCAACEWLDNLDRSKVLEHEVMLANNLRAQLEALTVKGLAILGDKAADHSGILSFYIKGLGSEDIANFLDDDGICVRSGHHCTQLAHSTLFGIDSSVRVSYGVYNTEDDNNRLVQSLTKAVALLSD